MSAPEGGNGWSWLSPRALTIAGMVLAVLVPFLGFTVSIITRNITMRFDHEAAVTKAQFERVIESNRLQIEHLAMQNKSQWDYVLRNEQNLKDIAVRAHNIEVAMEKIRSENATLRWQLDTLLARTRGSKPEVP